MPIPLIYPAVIAGSAIASWLTAGAILDDSEYERWKASVPPPLPPPTPAAPQTAQEMRSWNPQALTTADRRNFEAWKRSAIPYEPEPDDDSSPLNWALLIGAIAGVVLIVRSD